MTSRKKSPYHNGHPRPGFLYKIVYRDADSRIVGVFERSAGGIIGKLVDTILLWPTSALTSK